MHLNVIYCPVYKTNKRGEETDPCYGFLLLGQWPLELSVTHPHMHKKNPTHIKTCLCMASATIADLQADHGDDTHQGYLNTTAVRSLSLTRNDTQLERLFLATSPDSSSISFRSVSTLVSMIFLLCQSEVFYQSVCVTNSPTLWYFSSFHLIHLTGGTSSVNN